MHNSLAFLRTHAPGELLAWSFRGSLAYGLELPESDIDYFAIYAGERKSFQKIYGEYDVQWMQAGEYMRRIQEGNTDCIAALLSHTFSVADQRYQEFFDGMTPEMFKFRANLETGARRFAKRLTGAGDRRDLKMLKTILRNFFLVEKLDAQRDAFELRFTADERQLFYAVLHSTAEASAVDDAVALTSARETFRAHFRSTAA